MREATIHLSTDQLAAFGIGEFVSVFRAAGLRKVTELQCQRSGCLLVITVEDPVAPDTLSELGDLHWWEQIASDSGATYLCKLAVDAFEDGFDPVHEADTSRDGMTVTDDGIEITMVGSHDAVSDRVRDTVVRKHLP